ncbi:MAG: Peptidase family C25 [Candidatus Argoarchaeum ethanivorans]|uniref:Peptidase family C25 n=1 Tax=Candidatus Argoarchaeum ethanivorans TaxID=2608793 RepID=A0A811T5A0_9EURY|nr:MAG: Peptidase family C25 [Candidatus Argoarchaeum ethanivorans]
MNNRILKIGCLVAVLVIVGSAFCGMVSTGNEIDNTCIFSEDKDLFVTVVFNEPEITSATRDTESYDLITVKDCGLTTKISEPALPVKTVFVLLPQNKQVTDVKFSVQESKILSDSYTIYPAQPPACRYIVPEFVKPDPDVYASEAPLLAKIVELQGMEEFRGYKIALIKVHPIQYVPSTGEVTFCKRIQLELSHADSAPSYMPPKMPEVDSWIAEHVINPMMASEYTAPSQAIDYLIITRDMFLNESEALKSHKEAAGLGVAIETVENITGTYPGRDAAEKIRNCIVDYYNTSGIQWVLLMGDADPNTHEIIDTNWEVPTRYMYNPDYYTYTPTDYYYAGLDGDWDADGDSNFGESTTYSFVDEADWFPEVFVGRITATTTTEMVTQVEKLVSFTSATIDSFLMCGAVSDSSTDERELKEYIKDNFVPPFVVTDELYESSGTLTETNVINRINSHQPEIVNSAGHGGYTGLYPGPFFDTGTPASVTNHPYLWYAMACLAGGFDYDYGDCVGEAMMKDPDGSGIAWVGGTRVTWYWVGYPQHLYGLNGMQDWLFWEEFFDYADYRPGTCLYNSKVTYLGSGPDLTMEEERKNLFAYQLLGDPEIFIGEVIPDVTPPVITNVSAENVTCSAAKITWDTDELADSLVKYGNASGIYSMEAYDNTWITSHSIELTGLSPVTTYYFVVNSTDWSGNTNESAEYSFTTEDEPDIWVSPTEIRVNCSQGDVVNRTLTIGNDGDGTLVWEINAISEAAAAKQRYPADYYCEIEKDEEDTREGVPVTQGMGGPDMFGYEWIDSDEPDGPVFDYIDIIDTGTLVTYLGDDSYAGPFTIGFDFPYYENEYTQFYVQSNGVINFDDQYICYSNPPIPAEDAYNNLLAWCWDDLYYRSDSEVYYQTIDDKLVIQFVDYGEFSGSGQVNAEVILYPNGRIVYQYADFTGGFDTDGCTVGIENVDGTDGLEVAFNTPYLHDALAVEFRCGPPGASWLSFDPEDGEVAPHDQMAVTVTVNATDLEPGDYNATIQIASNDPDEPLENVSVCVSVLPPDIWVVPTEINETLYQGNVTNKTFTIGNDGNGTLIFEITDIPGISQQNYIIKLPGGIKSQEEGDCLTANAKGTNVSKPTELGINNIRILSEPIDVLLVAADYSNMIKSILLGFDDIATVDQFDARYDTPTLSELQEYDAVIVWPNYAFYDSVALGDVLADYVDSDGKVILGGFCWYLYGNHLEGRIMEPEYSPFTGLGDSHYSYASLGWYDASHPIMDGVSTATDYMRDYVTLNDAEGAELVAEWDDDELFVATQDSVIGINSYIGDAYMWTGDIPIILHNVLIWTAEVDWLTEFPTAGVVESGNQTDITVTLNATALGNGTYNATIFVWSNDPDENPVNVSVHLNVIDITPPVINVTSPVNGTRYNISSVPLNFTVTDPSEINWIGYSLDGAENMTIASGANETEITVNTALTNLTDGLHNVTVYANDTVGNMDASETIWFTVTAPDIWVTPTEINVTLYQGNTTNRTFTIGNDGVGTLVWEITDVLGISRQNYTLKLPGGKKSHQEDEGGDCCLTANANGTDVSEPTELSVTNLRISSEPIDVLLVAADYSDAIRSILLAFDDINTVDQFDAEYATPTLSELQEYDAVIVWPNYPFYDSVALGDVLADYTDSGGRVILSGFCWAPPPWALEGRITEPEYSPFTGLGDNHWCYADLGWYDQTHPIMDSVSSASDYARDYVTLNDADGAELVAEWDDVELFVGVQRSGSVIGMTSYIGDGYWWTGDIPILLHNALIWTAEVDWLTEYPMNGTIEPGNQTNITVTFNATNLGNGTYEATKLIWSNDLDENPVNVSVHLNVIDITPPVINVTSPVNSMRYNLSSVLLNFTVTDPSEIDWIGYSLDGEENVTITKGANDTEITVNTALTNLTDGLHNVTVYANDTASNMGASDTIWFNVTAPNIWVKPGKIDETLPRNSITNRTLTIGNNGTGLLEFEIRVLGTTSHPLKIFWYDDYEENSYPGSIRKYLESKGHNVTYSHDNVGYIDVWANYPDYDVVVAEHTCGGSTLIGLDEWFAHGKGYVALINGGMYADIQDSYIRELLNVTADGLPIGESCGYDWDVNDLYWSDQNHPIKTHPNSNWSINGIMTSQYRDHVGILSGQTVVAYDEGLAAMQTRTNVEGTGRIAYLGTNFHDSARTDPDTRMMVENMIIWTAGGVDWLNVTPMNGTVPPGNKTNVMVTINTTGIDIGKYNASIVIENTDLKKNPVIVPVNLSVVPSIISFYPTNTTPTQYIDTTNTFNVTTDQVMTSNDWYLLPALPYATTAENGTSSLTVTWSYAGKYNITYVGSNPNGSVNLTWIVTVLEPNESLLCTDPDPPSHDFDTVREEEERSWIFNITNCGGGELTWTASADKTWISISPTSGSTTTETDPVTVTINTTGLSVGKYTGNLTVDSNGGTKNGMINVTVVKPTTIVKVEQESQTVKSGDAFSVNVTVENVMDMGMDGATLNFEPSGMQLPTAGWIIEGEFLKSAGATIPIEIPDNAAGTATFSYSLLTPGVGVSGNGTIATIEFDTNASAEGVYNLNLTGVLLADSTGDTIFVSKIFNGTVTLLPLDINVTSPENNSIYPNTCVRLNFTVKPEGTALDWIGYSLDGGANVTIAGNTTVFDTLGVTPPCDHNIVVYANDTDGNMAASNTVYFTMHPGDIREDGMVNGLDLQRLAWAFLSEPGDPNWNERADLKCDNKIDGFDLQRLAWNFLNDYTVIC